MTVEDNLKGQTQHWQGSEPNDLIRNIHRGAKFFNNGLKKKSAWRRYFIKILDHV